MVYLSILLLLSDVLLAALRLGDLPDCVSQCWYINKYLHYALLLCAAMLMLPAMLMVTPDNSQFLAFFACAALVFVATVPCYLDVSQKKIHFISAAICAVSAIIWAFSVCSIALIGLTVVFIAVKDVRHRLLWAELACFTTAYLGVIFC